MSKDWKDILEPFANLYYQMEQKLVDASPEELSEILNATIQPTSTNSWYATYAVAKTVLPKLIEGELGRRRMAERRQGGA